MIHVTWVPERKLLRVLFSGAVSKDDLRGLKESLETHSGHITEGFRILTDLTELEKASLDDREEIAQVMELMNALGVTEIVRVIPDPERDIGLNIMSLFHYDRDVTFRTFESLEDAEKYLGSKGPAGR